MSFRNHSEVCRSDAGGVTPTLERLLALLMCSCLGLIANGQTSGPKPSGIWAAGTPMKNVQKSARVQAREFREIEDLHTGIRWLILHDIAHPAGPGRMIPAAAGVPAGLIPSGTTRAENQGRPKPVIHGGDRVVVEDRTATAEAYLEGIALGPAAVQTSLHVRLRIGGKVVKAMALAPGRVALAAAAEVSDEP